MDRISTLKTAIHSLLLAPGQREFRDAESMYIRSLAIWEKVLGPEHSLVALALRNYAGLMRAIGREIEAESPWEIAIIGRIQQCM